MSFLTHPEPELDEQRLREHEADFTPYPVALQCVKAARDYYYGGRDEPHGLHVMDPAAGAGVWLQAAHAVLDISHAWAIEKRAEEEPNLLRTTPDVEIADFLSLPPSRGAYDIALTNVPFSLFVEYCWRSLEWAEMAWLFAPIDVCTRGADKVAAFRDLLPFVDILFIVPGAIGYRGPGTSSDFRTYGLWCLHQDSVGDADGHLTTYLEMLPGHDRKWVTRPGTEVRT